MKMSFRGMMWGLIACVVYGGLAMAEPKFQFDDFRIVEPPAVARHVAAYGKMTNIGNAADTLIAVKSNAAQTTELHETRIHDGKAHMHTVPHVLLKPGDTLALKPKSYHVMLKGLKQPLKAGDVVRLTFVFKKAGNIIAEAPVLTME